MNEPKNKRTKAWKEWNALNSIEVKEPKYLGDYIEDATKAIGIKQTEDCGCGNKKEALNKYSKKFLDLFTVRRKPIRCLTIEQYNSYTKFIETRTLNLWQQKDIQLLIDLYAHVFSVQYNAKDLCINCSGSGKILFKITEELDIVYNAYDN